jgi:hypothetical protein
MAVKISGTTVIDDSRNITNILTATSNTAVITYLQDSSNRTLKILNAAGTVVWGSV